MARTLSRYRTTVATSGRDVLVTYAGTLIVRAEGDTITLNSAGWRTVTTKRKMCQASHEFGLGFGVHQHRGEWYVTRHGRSPEGWPSASPEHGAITLPYSDGMTFQRGCVVPGAVITLAA